MTKSKDTGKAKGKVKAAATPEKKHRATRSKKSGEVLETKVMAPPPPPEEKNDFVYFLYNGDELSRMETPPNNLTLVVQHKKYEASMCIDIDTQTIGFSFSVLRGTHKTLKEFKGSYDIVAFGTMLNKLLPTNSADIRR